MKIDSSDRKRLLKTKLAGYTTSRDQVPKLERLRDLNRAEGQKKQETTTNTKTFQTPLNPNRGGIKAEPGKAGAKQNIPAHSLKLKDHKDQPNQSNINAGEPNAAANTTTTTLGTEDNETAENNKDNEEQPETWQRRPLVLHADTGIQPKPPTDSGQDTSSQEKTKKPEPLRRLDVSQCHKDRRAKKVDAVTAIFESRAKLPNHQTETSTQNQSSRDREASRNTNTRTNQSQSLSSTKAGDQGSRCYKTTSDSN